METSIINQNLEEFANNGTSKTFCTIWPPLRAGLVIAEDLDPKLKPFIDPLIAAGDALSKEICG